MYIFKIPKSGYNYEDPDHKMIVHSKYPLLRKAFAGSGTLIKLAGQTSKVVEITHGLGYKPICYVFGNYLDQNAYPNVSVVNRYKYFSWKDTPGLQLWDYYTFYADTSKLYIAYNTNAYIDKQVALNYIYYILYEEDV